MRVPHLVDYQLKFKHKLLYFGIKTMRIGIVGFSRNRFDRKTARGILERELGALSKKIDPQRVEIVSGYTKSGVPELAYEVATALGCTTVGFSAKQALRVRSGVYPVDKVILRGERFGDESADFIAYVDGLIRVGGGPQSRREVALFREKYAGAKLERRLKEFEVDWFGKPPAEATLFEPPASGDQPLAEAIDLGDDHHLHIFRNVPNFQFTDTEFSALWESHPAEYHRIVMHGKEVRTPRWQQAYGHNYQYSGSRNNALPITPSLAPFLTWCRQHVDARLNGLLLNWYDGQLGHYIGAHRDSTIGLVKDCPIVTISLGEERIFRMRPHGGSGYQDFSVRHGDALVIPAATNTKWTHEIPKFKRYQGKRISVTVRGYV
ncbi:MAG: alpha-ketoglutarate-dependent dioxygenase AlkB [Bacteroidota bacterium]